MRKENENLKNNICCFFGHRDAPSDILPILKQEIENLIIKYDVHTFYVGGYGRFDGYAVNAVNDIKKKYKEIQLFLITAYLSTLESSKDYIQSTYDGTIYPDGLETTVQRFSITKRNRWMVEQSRFVIAYVNHSWGGAATAVQYAKRKNCKVINIGTLKQF